MKAFIVLALATLCAAAPRDKRFGFFDDFPRYSNPYVGAWAGAGFNPFFFNPFSFMPMFVPIVPPKPWYEGDNVCVEKKEADAPEFLNEWWNDDSFGGNFQQQSKECRGSNTRYVCLSREMTNKGNKMVATKYECCPGFVRTTDGTPGCVESSRNENTATVSPILMNGDYKSQYSFMSSNYGKK